VLGSAGVGFRMPVIPGFVFRLDVGRRFALNSPDPDPRESYYHRRFLDFFFGFNY
jgi:hypothetical protein